MTDNIMTKAKRTKMIYKALHRKSDAPHVVAVVTIVNLFHCYMTLQIE